MRQSSGESDMVVSVALLQSFSTFASGPAGKEKTLHPAAVPNNHWRDELSRMKRLPLVLHGRSYILAVAAVATDLEGRGAGMACHDSNLALLPWREMEDLQKLLDLDLILPNSMSHQDSVAAAVSSSASVSSSCSSWSSSPTSARSTCSFCYLIRTGVILA